MMKKTIASIAILIIPLLVMLSVFVSQPVSAQPPASGSCNQDRRFLGAPAWHRGVLDDECNVSLDKVSDNPDLGGKIGPFLLIVGLNIVEIIMVVVAYTSVIYIIVGGFKYITSAGSADGSVRARKTITNAVIGLIISIVGAAVITFIVNGLITGSTT